MTDSRFLVIGSFVVLVAAPWFAHARSPLYRTPNVIENDNSQNMALLEAPINIDPSASDHPQLAIVDNSALTPEGDTGGTTFVDAGKSGTGQISVYVVRSGDTLSSIAQMYGVSANTIVWANDIKRGIIHEGDQLVILPISGISHTVVKGDTLQSITKKYGADLNDILSYNSLSANDSLTVGQVIIIPDGEPVSSAPSVRSSSSSGSAIGHVNSCGLKVSTYERLLVNPCSYPVYDDYYTRPIKGGVKTQNLHGYNAIDLAAPVGTPIYASASGKVIISRTGGYNGGYGTYVVISHPNGTQTLYAHMSKNLVSVGESVEQGQQIGAIGMTGKTTGPHIHFEIRGAKNPF